MVRQHDDFALRVWCVPYDVCPVPCRLKVMWKPLVMMLREELHYLPVPELERIWEETWRAQYSVVVSVGRAFYRSCYRRRTVPALLTNGEVFPDAFGL